MRARRAASDALPPTSAISSVKNARSKRSTAIASGTKERSRTIDGAGARASSTTVPRAAPRSDGGPSPQAVLAQQREQVGPVHARAPRRLRRVAAHLGHQLRQERALEALDRDRIWNEGAVSDDRRSRRARILDHGTTRRAALRRGAITAGRACAAA